MDGDLPPVGTLSQISSGYSHSCALKSDGNIVCWGYAPTPPAGVFSQISSGYSNVCALKKEDNSAVCSGGNDWGRDTPPSGVFKQISTGLTHSCALKVDNSIICWGDNEYGQIMPPTGTFSQVSSSWYHSCGLKNDGNVVCWGRNDYSQATPPVGTFSQVSAGYMHTCALKRDGGAVCWGLDGYGLAPPNEIFTQISAGDGGHICGLKSDGSAICWGRNDGGQANVPVEKIYTLTLNKTGNGSIGGGGSFTANSTVNLSTIPDADSKFVGWSPSPCANSFQMPANDLTCTVTFVPKQKYSLNLTKAEHGTILAEGINCGADCNETYVENTVVTLNAMPETGYKLESWSGDCVGGSNSCQITMNTNKTVNASFSLIPSYPLTLQTSGDGLGSISGNGNYRVGETVNLTASPDANSVFVDWKPAPCNSSFEMPNNALTCIATFNKKGTPPSSGSNADLSFSGIQPFYNVGEWVHARLKTQLNVASRFNRVDLWVAIQLPDKTLLFMTGSYVRPFSLQPEAFKRSLEQMDAEIVVLDTEVIPNMGGDYIFYALYVETGKNPITDGFTIQRSNLAIATTTLRNR